MKAATGANANSRPLLGQAARPLQPSVASQPVGISEEELNARIEAAVQKHLEKKQKETELQDNPIKKSSPVLYAEQVTKAVSARSDSTAAEQAEADSMSVEERKDRAKVLVNLARQRHDE
jgi:predicted RNase H-like HicB family nuclease